MCVKSFGIKQCEQCRCRVVCKIKRDLVRKRFCSRRCLGIWMGLRRDLSEFIKRGSTPQANAKKGHKGKDHPKWISDRNKLKQKRLATEERWFLKKVLYLRGFRCELTGKKGKMSVHHIKPVWKYPNLKLQENNVIVITKQNHKLFHKVFGMKADENDWQKFIERKMYARS